MCNDMRQHLYNTFLNIDASLHLAAFILCSITVCFTHTIQGFLVLLCLFTSLCYVEHIGYKTMLKALRPISIIAAISFASNMLQLKSSGIEISFVHVAQAFEVLLRIFLLVGFALVMWKSSTESEIARAVSKNFVRFIKSPELRQDVELVILLALKFIPISLEEYKRCVQAQQSRGVSFNDGSIAQRLHKWIGVFIPLILGLFRRSDEVAQALQDRCYGMCIPTDQKSSHSQYDIWYLVLIIAVCVCALIL